MELFFSTQLGVLARVSTRGSQALSCMFYQWNKYKPHSHPHAPRPTTSLPMVDDKGINL